MDDRKKRIDDLVKNNKEARTSLDTLLENLGENLYSRACSNSSGADDVQIDSEDIAQYNIYLQEIAEANAAIGKIEEKNRRFRELEEAIEA